jgi:hypothetical protein
MRWRSPRTATRQIRLPDATLSPAAKLLVSRDLHRCGEPGRCLLLARRRCPGRRDRGANALVSTSLAIVVRGATGNAWANPQPAETPRRLVLGGGFVVDGGRDRHLEQRAGVLGFDDLRAYLQARCDTGYSIPQIATELRVSDWKVQAALARSGVRLAPAGSG